MASGFLNYTILGRNSFEVFSYNVEPNMNDVQVETILQDVSSRQDMYQLLLRMECWLVCEISTPNRWANG